MSLLETLTNENLLQGKEEVEEREQEENLEEQEEGNQEGQEEELQNQEDVVQEEEELENEEEENEQQQEEETPNEEELESPSKLKVDYAEFIKDNLGVIASYHAEKDADYSKMSAEEIAFKSLKVKYPTLSDSDIKEELKDRFGLGEDTEDMDSEELIAHKAKQRKLKIFASDSIKELEQYRDSLTLPDFEVEIPGNTQKVATEREEVDIEELYNAKAQEQEEADKKWRQEQWIPAISGAAKKVQSISNKVNIEGIGEIEVSVDLDESDHKAITEYLAPWIYHPGDNKFINDKGDVDMEAFVRERGSAVMVGKISQAVAEVVAKRAKDHFIKNNVVNYNDDGRRANVDQYESGQLDDLIGKLRN